MKSDKIKITLIICGTIIILTLIIVLSIFIASQPELGKGIASFILGAILAIQPYLIGKIKGLFKGGEKDEIQNVIKNTNESNSTISKK